jgi:PAS domain S-box-containing protein
VSKVSSHPERQRLPRSSGDREALLEAILNTAVEGIITIDESGIVEGFNPAAEKIFGYPAAQIVGGNVSQLMPLPERARHDQFIANYLDTGNARVIGIGREVVGRRKDGSTFPMDLSVSEVRLQNGRRRFTGFVRDISERKRLEREILEISERERRSIGHSLHDGLCQQLVGIELLSRVLERSLDQKSKTDAEQAGKIAQYVRDAISQTRMLARGLSPVSLHAEGLMAALQELSTSIANLFSINCRFECPKPILVPNATTAAHLYRIAQEAINNSVKHGKAQNVLVQLLAASPVTQLIVNDDGTGFSASQATPQGMGLQIMQYRANIIGATLEIQSAINNGARVVCTFKS